jgi:hypothetical protein
VKLAPARLENMVSIQSRLYLVDFGLQDIPLWMPSKNFNTLVRIPEKLLE